MTRTVIWKELREQAAVVLALVALGCGLMAALAILVDPQDRAGVMDVRSYTATASIGLLMLTVTAGVVVGGTLFAGEREGGTFAFLDRLPGSRWRVWWRKVLAGLGMATAATAALFGTAAALGLLGNVDEAGPWAAVVAMVGFLAFAWGTVGSVIARTSLAACGSGIGLGAGTMLALMAVLALGVEILRNFLPLDAWFGGNAAPREILPLVALFATLVLPLAISAFLYTAPDRDRAIGGFAAIPTATGEMRTLRLPTLSSLLPSLPSVGRVGRAKRFAWLTVRQQRVPVLVLSLLALLFGCILVPPEVVFVTVWPGLGLVFGVLAGVSGLGDEQAGESSRFWGERRLRVGGLWWAKVGFGLGLVVWLTLMLMTPSLVRVLLEQVEGRRTPVAMRLFSSGIVGDSPGFPIVGLLLLGPVYGFAFAHLAAMLFRKALVAGAVGLMLGGMYAVFWLPSLFAGGVHARQLWLPPLAVLLVARLTAWSWTTNALATRGPLRRVALGLLLVTGLMGAGLAERAYEVPETAAMDDDIAFSKTLPSFDDLQAGRDMRRAASDFQGLANVVWEDRPETLLVEGAETRDWGDNDYRRSFGGQLYLVLEGGYPPNRPDFDEWLDHLGAGDWQAILAGAAKKPTGVFEDPNEMQYDYRLTNLMTFQKLVPVYLLCGLKRQHEGDPADFVARLEVVLAVVRNTRNNSVSVAANTGRYFEAQAIQALTRWLERLEGRPDLLARVGKALWYHDQVEPYDPRHGRLADQVVARNGLTYAAQWLPRYLEGWDAADRRTYRDRSTSGQSELQGDVIAFMWSVPWEKERLRRAVGYGNTRGSFDAQQEYLRGIPGQVALQSPYSRAQGDYAAETESIVSTARRAVMIQVALRGHAADAGAFPATLAALVPKYLPAVPKDPYAPISNDDTFRYRVASKAETIAIDPPETRMLKVPLDPLTRVGWDMSGMGTYVDQVRGFGSVVGGWMYWNSEGDPDADPQRGDQSTDRMQMAFGNGVQVTVVLEVQPGQAVVWSVGPDLGDDGGRTHLKNVRSRFGGGDIVTVVPLTGKPPAKP